MKKIGGGWQHTVYDIGGGRVRKIFNTKTQSYFIFLRECFPYTKFPLWKFSDLYKNMLTKAQTSLSWIQQTTLDPSLFGNPKILNDSDYEQDLLVPINKYLRDVSVEDGRKIVDNFVLLSKLFIENEVIDKSFLIGKNYGINKDGKIILTDIGELFVGKEKVMNQVNLKPWDHPYVTKTIPKQLRMYFVKEMDKLLE
jgi:hypothetical protein